MAGGFAPNQYLAASPQGRNGLAQRYNQGPRVEYGFRLWLWRQRSAP